ncbi:hypothetical protein [Sphingomonas sp.]|uniref:hypothetical protein n=1 Tax=Sphingomonas sp. TaxID=28214 RepID=UPI00307EA4FC
MTDPIVPTEPKPVATEADVVRQPWTTPQYDKIDAASAEAAGGLGADGGVYS